MLATALPSRATVPANLMTFRVYLRWPGQRVSEKTTTDSRAVAELAFRELEAQAVNFANQGALGIAMTENGAQVEYRTLRGVEGADPSALRN